MTDPRRLAERIALKLSLRPSGAKLLTVLLARDLAAPGELLAALDSSAANQAAALKVQMCRLRTRIAPVRIETVYAGARTRATPNSDGTAPARGYRLADKKALLALAGPDPCVDRLAIPRAATGRAP